MSTQKARPGDSGGSSDLGTSADVSAPVSSSNLKSEAARWLVALEASDDMETLWPEFEAWLNRDPEHRQAFLRVERAWRTLGQALRMSSKDENLIRNDKPLRIPTRFAKRLPHPLGPSLFRFSLVLATALLISLALKGH